MDTIRLDSKLRDKAQYAKEPNLSSEDIVARVKALSKTCFENVSKVVDENGKPKVMYHGALTAGIREFQMGRRCAGKGLSSRVLRRSPSRSIPGWRRMIPDIVENYDSVELINAKKGYSLVFTKEYGDVVYVVAETIASKKETPRGTRQKTIYLNEITKKASSRAFHPTPFSKNFTRTEIVNPVTAFIKQNYAAEARKGSVSDLLVIILGSIRFHEVKSLNVRLRIRSVIKNAFLQFYKHSK